MPAAVKTTLPPVQKVAIPPALIVGVAGSATTTTVVAVLVDEQLKPFVTVTEYEPDVVAVYVDSVPTTDDPLLQEYNEPVLAVKTTLPPEQKVVAPSAAIVAVVAAGCVIVTEAVAVQELASVTVTE